MRSRSSAAAHRLSSRNPLAFALSLVFVALAVALGPAKPDFHLSWPDTIEIPAIGDFDQAFAPKYLLPSTPLASDSSPLQEALAPPKATTVAALPAPAASTPAAPVPAIPAPAVPVLPVSVAVPSAAAAAAPAAPAPLTPVQAGVVAPAVSVPDRAAFLAAQFAGAEPDPSPGESTLAAAVEQLVQVEKGDTLISVL